MKKISEAKKRLYDARCEADAILATGANRLVLIEAILVLCLFAALFTSLASALSIGVSALLGETDTSATLLGDLISLLFVALVVFFAAPVVLGVFRLGARMQAGEEPMLGDMFYFLSSRQRYLLALRTSWLGSLKLLVAIAAIDAIGMIWTELVPDTLLFDILSVFVIAIVIFLYLIWLLFPYSKLYFWLQKDEAPKERDVYLRSPRGGLRFLWFFLPWLLLGCISIGLLLVLDVFPRMMLTYFCDCERKNLTD